MSTSATQRSLAYLKRQGYKTGVVERWVSNPKYPGGGKRIDLFSIIDLISIQGPRTIGVQTTGTGFAPHHLKLTEEKREETIDWLYGGSRELWLIGWRKLLAKRGGKRRIWKPRLREYFLNPVSGELDWQDTEG